MVGVVVVAHYRLGEELLQALRLIVPESRGFAAVSVEPKQSIEEMRASILEAIDRVEEGTGVLILTDMFGGTPSNLAMTFLGPEVEVITGVNLPMLIKLAEVRGKLPLAEAALAAQEAGRKYISVASALLQRAE